MTVQELIKELRTKDGDDTVYIQLKENDICGMVKQVIYSDTMGDNENDADHEGVILMAHKE